MHVLSRESCSVVTESFFYKDVESEKDQNFKVHLSPIFLFERAHGIKTDVNVHDLIE